MAKTIETLRRPVFKEDVLHSHIADTYFHKNTHTTRRKKKRVQRLNIDIPKLLITLAIASALSLLIFITGTFLYKQYLDMLQKKTAALTVIDVVRQGTANKTIMRRFDFRGHARRIKNTDIKDTVILSNPKKYNWADMSVDFKFPIDMKQRVLVMALRGNVGGEKISVVVRDTKNRSARLGDLSLSSSSKEKVIHMSEFKGDIDMSNIDHVRLECGHAGESASQMDSPINVTIYVNNISLVKEGEV